MHRGDAISRLPALSRENLLLSRENISVPERLPDPLARGRQADQEFLEVGSSYAVPTVR